MKKILIDARDFAFYWSTTQGNEPGGIDGKIKFGGFLFFYYWTFLFLAGNLYGYLGYKTPFRKDASTIVEAFILH
jgi:hypothetical protein